MKKLSTILFCASAILAGSGVVQAAPVVYTAPGMTVGVGDQGILSGPYNLTAIEGLIVKATLNLNGLDDLYHTIFKLGVHDTDTSENLMTGAGHGVWLATDHNWWVPGDFGPDPVGSPISDMDDKFILARQSDWPNDETAYNLPGVPPAPYSNHYIWFDRDGVDSTQALNPLNIDGQNYNTGGIYDIELHLRATSATTGEAYLTVNGLSQGFETDGKWNTMEMSPAGMTFTGDMTNMQVFFGVKGWVNGEPGHTNPGNPSEITIVGVPEPGTLALLGLGLAGLAVSRRRRQ